MLDYLCIAVEKIRTDIIKFVKDSTAEGGTIEDIADLSDDYQKATLLVI